MTRRELNLSKRWPIKGWVMPFMSQPMPAAMDMVVRFQSKASLMGITKTPKPLRAPVVTAAMNIAAATTYQP